MMGEYIEKEIRLFKKLNSPQKIQDFLNSLAMNVSSTEPICLSPRRVLEEGKAHCMEGALLAAAILEYYGARPLVMDLRATENDFDHTVAIFKKFDCFGAISKTNHAALRYREPVYKTIRELALSYFHEYIDNKSKQKTLREYSKVFDLNHFNFLNWRTTRDDLYEIPAYLDDIQHYKILSPQQIKNLRRADEIEIKAGEIVEWK